MEWFLKILNRKKFIDISVIYKIEFLCCLIKFDLIFFGVVMILGVGIYVLIGILV